MNENFGFRSCGSCNRVFFPGILLPVGAETRFKTQLVLMRLKDTSVSISLFIFILENVLHLGAMFKMSCSNGSRWHSSKWSSNCSQTLRIPKKKKKYQH